MFSPLETLDDDFLIDLIYAQIVIDVFSESIRITRDDIVKMKSFLSKYQTSLCIWILRQVQDWQFIINLIRHGKLS
jgi:hypothetical protein